MAVPAVRAGEGDEEARGREAAVIYTDRSRTIEFQRCPRARYWGYEYRGRGVAPIRLSIPLAVGTYVHVGLGAMLSDVRDERPVDVDEAVRMALAGYDDLIQRRGLNVEANAEMQFTYQEQRALIEAMIRAYAIRRLPLLLEEFEVLEVEREDEFELGPVPVGVSANTDGNLARVVPVEEPLSWMSRADGLLRRKADGDLYVLSFKTAGDWDIRKENENSHDMQGLSESAAIEDRLARDWERVHVEGAFNPAEPASTDYENWLKRESSAPRIMGVKMEFLLKGDRRKNKVTGRYEQYSPLIRAWRQQGITQDDDRYAWRYEWEEEDPQTGLSKTRRLGKGWTPFFAWELSGGVKGWIARLASGTVQPEAGDALDAQFITPIPYFRHEADIARWRRQVTAQEIEVARTSREARKLDGLPFEEIEPLLDRHFRQHTRACDWPVRCPFQDLCFGGAAYDPVGSELYVWREPHHEPELVQIKEAEIRKAA